MGISGRDGRMATVGDAFCAPEKGSVRSEPVKVSQASPHLQSPEVWEQQSASSSSTDKAGSTCFLFQD